MVEYSTVKLGRDSAVTVDTCHGLAMCVFMCNFDKKCYMGQIYDCTRKHSLKKENNIFLVMIFKDRFLY